MKKNRHNKKRNTAVLYEVLVRELTRCVVENNKKGKKATLSIIKEFFKKDSVLGRELELYKTLNESSGLSDELARRLVDKVIASYDKLDSSAVFEEQTKLLKKMSQEMPKTVFTNFIPDYKNLASISQIFSHSTPVKEKVLLEQNMVKALTSKNEVKEAEKLEVIDNLTYKTFVKNFNKVYGSSLLPEQKDLMTRYVMSFSDNGVSLKMFLNEEIGRLKEKVKSSLLAEEIKEDNDMTKKTHLVLERMDSYHNKPIDKTVVGEILKIQALVQEIQS